MRKLGDFRGRAVIASRYVPLSMQQVWGERLDAPVAHDLFVFEGFCLDRHSGGLFRRDPSSGLTPVTIGSRALDVLGVLVSHPGELLSKQVIMQAVWPGMVVDEKNLTVQIAALRRALDNGRTDRSCIQTEAGRGYRFVVPVTLAASLSATPPASVDAPVPARQAPKRYQLAIILAAAGVVVVGAVLALAWTTGWIGPSGAPARL